MAISSSFPSNSGNMRLNPPCARFQLTLDAASARFSSSVVRMLPAVISSSVIYERRPLAMVAALHAGFHVSGWKEDMVVHSFTPGAKRPVGVHM